MAKEKKTIMIIGLGGQGHSWMHSIKKHPGYDLIGFVDTDMEMLSHAKEMGFEEENAFPSIEDACRYGEKPDVVVIATPINTHHSITRECMELGINTICEKNMASTIPMGKQMVQMAMDHPELSTALGTQYRFESANWTAKCFLQGPDNSIGNLGSISWQSIGWRGDRRWGWRRFLQEVYTEDMSVHYFDLMRYCTGMDIVQIKADTFMPRYSDWHGSSTIFATLALAKKDDYYNRHNWVWCTFVGDWQRRGPTFEAFEFFGSKGQMKINGPFGLELKLYNKPDDWTKFEEDGYLNVPDVENMGTDYTGQGIILEQMSRSIDSGGENQPMTNFKLGFKSFAVSMGAIESSFTGQAVWVPKYWDHFLD